MERTRVTRVSPGDTTLQEIRVWGFSVYVQPAVHPYFSYTVGLSLTHQHPELLMVASPALSRRFLFLAGRAVVQGVRFTPGIRYPLLGSACQPVQVVALEVGMQRWLTHARVHLHTAAMPVVRVRVPANAAAALGPPASPWQIIEAEQHWRLLTAATHPTASL